MTRNRLVLLLAARGWTDADLAARAHVGRSHVNEIKNGRAIPRVATALRIADALATSVSVVFPAGSSATRRPLRHAGRAATPGAR